MVLVLLPAARYLTLRVLSVAMAQVSLPAVVALPLWVLCFPMAMGSVPGGIPSAALASRFVCSLVVSFIIICCSSASCC